MLLGNGGVDGDLFKLATAWNGGPGNLQNWEGRVKHMNDPLLFIESIPAGETRNFIERVLANLWIYRHRFGQPTPALDALAAGRWPAYRPQDNTASRVATYGAN
jgi:soluble lytic murein transglycosylase-like protein